MRPRQTVVEQFSSLARLSDSGFHGWICDPRLKKSMEQQLEQAAQRLPDQGTGQGVSEAAWGDRAAERYWSIYWLQAWRTESHGLADESSGLADKPPSLAESHIIAYLQEPCYWVAQELSRKILSIQKGTPSSHTVLDLFQMAMGDLRPVLSKFSLDRSSSLKAFTQRSLSVRGKSTLRQRREVDFCTPWSLLRNTGKKLLMEALVTQGLSAAEIEQCRLLLIGFKTLYNPTHAGGAAKLPTPTEALWQSLAEFYNQKRHSFLSSPSLQIESGAVKALVTNIAGWIRLYLYPPQLSLNKPRLNADGEAGELIETLSNRSEPFSSGEPAESSLLDNLLEQEQETERHQSQRQVQAVLEAAFHQLDEQTRTILCLLYCQGFNQTETARQVAIAQPTVSRRVCHARKELLKALLQWTEQQMNKKPEPAQLTGITTLLGEWLKVYLRETDLCR